MSLAALCPLIQVIGRVGSSAATASGIQATPSSVPTFHIDVYGFICSPVHWVSDDGRWPWWSVSESCAAGSLSHLLPGGPTPGL